MDFFLNAQYFYRESLSVTSLTYVLLFFIYKILKDDNIDMFLHTQDVTANQFMMYENIFYTLM